MITIIEDIHRLFGVKVPHDLLAPAEKSDWCDNKGYDMIQGMHGFIRDKKDGEIAEVRG